MPEVVGRLRPPRIASAPASPANGEVYYDTSLNTIRYWNGTVWISVSTSEIAYTEITATVSVTATSAATATTIATAPALTFDGATPVWVTFSSAVVAPPTTAGAIIILELWDGSTDLGILAQVANASTSGVMYPVNVTRLLTPSAGSHTYSVRGWITAGSGANVQASAGGASAQFPAYIRVTGYSGSSWLPKTLRTGHTWAVPGALAAAQSVPPIFVPEASAQATTLIAVRARIGSGTSVGVQLQRNGSNLGSLITVTPTAASTTFSQLLSDLDLLGLVLSAPTGSPTDLSATLFLEHVV